MSVQATTRIPQSLAALTELVNRAHAARLSATRAGAIPKVKFVPPA
jgi:hypothetical protein